MNNFQECNKTTDRCVGIFGWLFGHNFQPRKTEKIGSCAAFPSGTYAIMSITDSMLDKYRERKTFYHGDVCQRCGKVVNEQ